MEQRMIKIQDAMKSHFIGEIQFDDDEIEEMKLDCRRFYQRVQQSWSKVYSMSEISELIVLIVNIAKTWNDESEGRFWIKLFGEIFEDGSISPVKFYNDFEACLKFYHKALFRSKENKRMFREVFLLHAFAPQKSGEEFIRLLWNWFCDEDVVNFDYQQGDIVFEKLAQFLKKEFGGKTDLDEEVNFEGKTYSIKASFKYLFTQDTESGVVLLDKLFSYFDDIYFNGKYDSESYFAECCAEVIEKIQRENSQPTERRARKTTEHIISDYSKIYSGYEIDSDGSAFLFIPEIRAIDEVAEEYVVNIYNGTEKIYSIDGYIVGSNIKKRIRRIAIPFSAFAGTIQGRFEIEVKLSVIRAGQEIEIYSSARSLYRDFILFKSSREVRSEICKPGTYYFICGENSDLSKITNCGLRNLNRYTSVITAEENDYIRSENQVVFFNQTAKDSHVIIDGTRCENVVFQKNEMEFPMYKKVKSLNILCTNYAMLEHMMLRPENDKIFAGSDFKFVVLDEAHIYTGATGMETALLLRRLKARIKSTDKTQFILTSATLGEEGKSEAEIINFAQNLCGEPFSASDIVYGRRDEVVFNDPINTAPITIFEELAENEETDFPSIFAKYQISYDYGEDGIEFEFEGGKQFLAFSDSRSEAAFFASYLDKSYKEFLRRRGLVRVLEKLHDDLLEAPMPLDELADELSKLFTKKESFKNELTERLSSRELRRLSLKNIRIAGTPEKLQKPPLSRFQNSQSYLTLPLWALCQRSALPIARMSRKS